MPKQQKLNKLRQAIIKELYGAVEDNLIKEKVITLCDILSVMGVDTLLVMDLVKLWYLSQDNLDLQSKETIDFLTDIICKKDE